MNDEFIAHYNRLRGTSVSFKDNRSVMERMVDRACGITGQEGLSFCSREQAQFLDFCVDMFDRLPAKAGA